MLVVSETLTKTNLKRNWFVSLILPRNRPLLRSVRAGTQARAEAGAMEKIYLLSAIKKKPYRLIHRLISQR